jgi:hypothetical protein
MELKIKKKQNLKHVHFFKELKKFEKNEIKLELILEN